MAFKGGTCLAKVHADFFRMSEDLDFVIPVTEEMTRGQRRKLAAPVKDALSGLEEALPCFRIGQPLEGANNSTQYVGSASYRSLITGQEETIKIEVALREPLLTSTVQGEARTALLDPVTGRPGVTLIPVRCLSRTEAFAEKFRAALSRRDVAARDFFDLDYAVRRLALRPDDGEFVDLVRRKLAVPGNGPIDVSERRLIELRQRVEPQLRPVLRRKDYLEFDVERAFRIVAALATRVG
jgi:predicted nucleotidyltransferase component of viral defense system